uniref:hypothetical protein n=1 Tax=Thaumasiovibrio occultus TaxID=1891184 RepID=UPI000B3648A5|nr:hypothetical protein [Thaumasiovibrio occultus]
MISNAKRLSISALLMALIAGVLYAKLFTAVLTFSDDPTSILVSSTTPLASNTLRDPIDENAYSWLLFDENGFIGDGLYFLVVDWAYVIIGVLVLFFGYSVVKRRRDVGADVGEGQSK